MRVLHTSDWHLGRTLHKVDLSGAHAAFLDHLVELCREESVDVVLVSGDVYDRALPPVESVELLDDALTRLAEVSRVVLTPGNHDSATRLGFGSRAFHDRLHVRSRPTDLATPIELPNRAGDESVLIFAAPYLDPNIVPRAIAEWADVDETGARKPIARSHQAVMSTAMGRVDTQLSKLRQSSATRTAAIVMAHAFVTGGAASDSERDLTIGGVNSIGGDTFSDAIDYVALGHLHGPQRVGAQIEGRADRVRYSGSPLPFSFSEMHHKKSSVLLDFAGGELVRGTLVPTPVPRRLSEVRGSLDELAGRAFDAQRDDWVRVTVVEPSRPQNMNHLVKQLFNHALEIRLEFTGGEQAASGTALASATPIEVLTDFVTQVSHQPPDEAERKVLQAALEATTAEETSL